MGSIQRNMAKLRAPLTGKGFIDGLFPVWNSLTSISISPGSAYIPSLAGNLEVPATLTLSGLAPANNTWYYLYLYSNAGVPAIELVTATTDAPYTGSARTKAGDTSRRFLAALKTGTTGFFSFLWTVGGTTQFTGSIAASPFRTTISPIPTTSTLVDLTSVVPPTSRYACIQATAIAGASGYDSYLGIAGMNIMRYIRGPMSGGVVGSLSNDVSMPTDANQKVVFWATTLSSGASVSLDVYGYGNDR